jgi:hypothetical protein
MIANRSSRAAFICTAAVLTSWALAAEAQTPANSKAGTSEAVATHKLAIPVNQSDKSVMDSAPPTPRTSSTTTRPERDGGHRDRDLRSGPALLRADTSSVKDRIAPMSLEKPNLVFIACGNTQANPSKVEGKPVTLLSEAKVMPSGVFAGWCCKSRAAPTSGREAKSRRSLVLRRGFS